MCYITDVNETYDAIDICNYSVIFWFKQ